MEEEEWEGWKERACRGGEKEGKQQGREGASLNQARKERGDTRRYLARCISLAKYLFEAAKIHVHNV
jgi:hypothetical protein